MADSDEREHSQEIEVYGELGLLPKVGVKIRLARKARFERVLGAAAEQAELDRDQLEDRLAEADDRVRDVVTMAAIRATEVDDEDYIDALGRLIAGALDSADIDELAYVTSEISKLEPVHLRALLGFFWFGGEGNEAADPGLSPADAAWAHNRYRSDREIAYLLQMTRESASQVLFTLDRDGFINRDGGPATDGETTSGPSDWAGRVVSMLFPAMKVEFTNTTDGSGGASEDLPPPTPNTAVAVRESDPEVRERRFVTELEAEIKNMERQRHSPLSLDVIGGDLQWLATLKRRLRRADPDNPWAYED